MEYEPDNLVWVLMPLWWRGYGERVLPHYFGSNTTHSNVMVHLTVKSCLRISTLWCKTLRQLVLHRCFERFRKWNSAHLDSGRVSKITQALMSACIFLLTSPKSALFHLCYVPTSPSCFSWKVSAMNVCWHSDDHPAKSKCMPPLTCQHAFHTLPLYFHWSDAVPWWNISNKSEVHHSTAAANQNELWWQLQLEYVSRMWNGLYTVTSYNLNIVTNTKELPIYFLLVLL